MVDFANKKFDYLVIGGGLAGLVVAARLSEDPSISVGILEAGGETLVPEVLVPGFFTKNIGNPQKDWASSSAPMTSAAGQPLYMPWGKGLGGTSMLNFMVFARSSSEDYDGFEKLGNKGWNWSEFLKYFKKSEAFLPPTPDIAEEYHLETHFNAEYHGSDGPLVNSLPRWLPDHRQLSLKAFEANGVRYNSDPGNGKNIGIAVFPNSINPANATRNFSVTAYYEPNKARKNLHVLTGAYVTRVLFSSDDDADAAIATGVEFVKDGQNFSVNVQKEVVLCAGAFHTPQILELSGIGDSSVLAKHGIHTVVDLPGVGNNLQDHPWVPLVYEIENTYESMECLAKPEVFAKHLRLYETERKGMFSSAQSDLAFLSSEMFMDEVTIDAMKDRLEAQVAAASGGRAAQLSLQREWFTDPASAQLEISQAAAMFVPFGMGVKPKPDTNYITLLPIVLHPLSRGSVHLASSDPLTEPTIDVAFLEQQFDLEILLHGIKFSRKVAATDPLRSALLKEVYPGTDVQSDEDLKDYARKFVGTLFHPLGTAAMMPREQQGVVSPNLVVYGTKNLRVVDASVIPVQLGQHPQSTIYAIAEKAADLMKL